MLSYIRNKYSKYVYSSITFWKIGFYSYYHIGIALRCPDQRNRCPVVKADAIRLEEMHFKIVKTPNVTNAMRIPQIGAMTHSISGTT